MLSSRSLDVEFVCLQANHGARADGRALWAPSRGPAGCAIGFREELAGVPMLRAVPGRPLPPLHLDKAKHPGPRRSDINPDAPSRFSN